ncbi:MBL fold metallo-hydrolase [Jannaschia sp. W003]|uniref:MBL fold metallo-hydrolase n=1 Tax=Jannaschia sp. W003 TaxID=2867012 RepID=UPI0021A70E47|nr:MBL fold metallo-hydrolase [Jannaschia sp. W003]UWQ21385.1 MBL fold metallo-hydrolase [Jannaschia sp. W003]
MIRTLAAMLAAAATLALPAGAQERRPSHCIAVADAAPGLVWRAAFGAPLERNSVRLNYVDHSMFLLETEGGLRAVTDYNGFAGVGIVPDVATMNRGHISHWTPDPGEGIAHVLRGWSEDRPGTPADHYLDLGEMLVRSVSTDLRPGRGGERSGNSIFVFEVAGLCIGHLGHLHHEPTPEQYAALGRLDVVMAPVDGGLTLPHATLARVLGRLQSSLVLPMHWFGEATLGRFLDAMAAEGAFAVERRAEPFAEVSLRTLPQRPTILVLSPRYPSAQ